MCTPHQQYLVQINLSLLRKCTLCRPLVKTFLQEEIYCLLLEGDRHLAFHFSSKKKSIEWSNMATIFKPENWFRFDDSVQCWLFLQKGVELHEPLIRLFFQKCYV